MQRDVYSTNKSGDAAFQMLYTVLQLFKINWLYGITDLNNGISGGHD
jgi:hypothetical protein